jgi:hypothetical protein
MRKPPGPIERELCYWLLIVTATLAALFFVALL